jgi:hypothetical protein
MYLAGFGVAGRIATSVTDPVDAHLSRRKYGVVAA